MKSSILSFAVSIFLLTGCSSNKEYDIKTTETNGVKTVSNPNYPKEGVYDLVPEEVYTLGKEKDNSKYIFSRPIFMELDSKENLYVSDYDGPKYFVFNNKGEFLRSFGKQGAGPGDLGGLSFFKISSDDKLVINDMWNGRICRFSLNGEYINGFTYKKYHSDIGLNSKDIIFATEDEYDKNKITDKLEFQNITKKFIKYDPVNNEGIVIKTFQGEKNKMLRNGNGTLTVGPFNEFVWKISPSDRLYTGFADTYEFNVFDLAGNQLLKFSREYSKIVNPRYKKTHKGEEYLPAFTRFNAFDSAGNFWVNEDNGDSVYTYIYDIFSEDGVFQKQVHSNYKIQLFRGDKIYTFVQKPKEPVYVKAFKYYLKKREK